jgi:hypothetical protein
MAYLAAAACFIAAASPFIEPGFSSVGLALMGLVIFFSA